MLLSELALSVEAFGQLEKKFSYPYSMKWIVISLVLTFFSFVFAIIYLSGYVFLFLLYTGIVTALLTLVKYSLYSKFGKVVDTPLFPPLDMDEEPHSGWMVIFLVVLIFLGLIVPFLMLAVVDPVTWFTLLIGFVAGINIPELILYAYSRSQKTE